MEIKKIHWIGIGISIIVILSSLLFIGNKFFFLMIGLGVLIGASPFVFTLINETKIESEKEEMFLEFTRNLVESVNTGVSISKSIINLKNKPYGVLSENIQKLANQISLGIPLNLALQVFSRDVNNKTVTRAITLIGQAEKAGGDIGEILESVAGAVNMSDKLKKERKSTISSLVVQGYIIYLIFMVIILIMQFQIIPIIGGISGIGGETGLGVLTFTQQEISSSFLYLLLIQGFFTGLVIGKLSEGNVKPGIKHSFALMLISFLVSAIANLFFG